MQAILSLVWEGLPATLAVTFGALTVGIVVAVPVTMLRLAPWLPVRAVTAAGIQLVRVVPPIVWIFLVYYSVGSSDYFTIEPEPAAIVGLGLIAGAYIAEIYRSGLAAVPPGQREALDALAVPRRVGYPKVVIPQAMVLIVGPVTSYAVLLLKDSALASVIGAVEITFLALEHAQLTLTGLQTFAVVGLAYLVLGLLIAWGGRAMERRFESRWSYG